MQAVGLTGLFLALGLALADFGLVTAIAIASGVWFGGAKWRLHASRAVRAFRSLRDREASPDNV